MAPKRKDGDRSPTSDEYPPEASSQARPASQRDNSKRPRRASHQSGDPASPSADNRSTAGADPHFSSPQDSTTRLSSDRLSSYDNPNTRMNALRHGHDQSHLPVTSDTAPTHGEGTRDTPTSATVFEPQVPSAYNDRADVQRFWREMQADNLLYRPQGTRSQQIPRYFPPANDASDVGPATSANPSGPLPLSQQGYAALAQLPPQDRRRIAGSFDVDVQSQAQILMPPPLSRPARNAQRRDQHPVMPVQGHFLHPRTIASTQFMARNARDSQPQTQSMQTARSGYNPQTSGPFLGYDIQQFLQSEYPYNTVRSESVGRYTRAQPSELPMLPSQRVTESSASGNPRHQTSSRKPLPNSEPQMQMPSLGEDSLYDLSFDLRPSLQDQSFDFTDYLEEEHEGNQGSSSHQDYHQPLMQGGRDLFGHDFQTQPQNRAMPEWTGPSHERYQDTPDAMRESNLGMQFADNQQGFQQDRRPRQDSRQFVQQQNDQHHQQRYTAHEEANTASQSHANQQWSDLNVTRPEQPRQLMGFLRRHPTYRNTSAASPSLSRTGELSSHRPGTAQDHLQESAQDFTPVRGQNRRRIRNQDGTQDLTEDRTQDRSQEHTQDQPRSSSAQHNTPRIPTGLCQPGVSASVQPRPDGRLRSTYQPDLQPGGMGPPAASSTRSRGGSGGSRGGSGSSRGGNGGSRGGNSGSRGQQHGRRARSGQWKKT